ncbi:MAG: redox-active disulfide protein 2 [Bacteroidota bacterium]|jgi:Flp pilus assembly protein TadB
MKSKNLKEWSVEELLKQQKTIKLVTGVLIGMLSTLLIIGISLTFQEKSFASFIVIPIALLPIVFLNLTTLKKVKEELNSRENLR